MKWYYDDNKLEQFYNFQKKYYAEISNKFWSLLSPEDYDGCYMSTSMDIGEDTMDILKYSFEHNIDPNGEFDRRQKLKQIQEKVDSINEEFGTEPTYSWKDKLRSSVKAYEAQENEIFSCIFEHYYEQKRKESNSEK